MVAGVDRYLTAGRDKILPADLFRITSQLSWRRSLSEVVELDQFTAIVSDVGILAIDDIPGLAIERSVAPKLA
jgi:hypothetical protein